MSTSGPHTLRGLQGTRLDVPQRMASWPVLVAHLAANIVRPPRGKRALLIAISYAQTPLEDVLQYPPPDALTMAGFLQGDRTGYRSEDVKILSDAPGTPEDQLPTYNNIMREISQLVKSDVKDYVVLYSGHSGQQPVKETAMTMDDNASDEHYEEDQMDEFIIPVDAVIGPSLSDLDKSKIILDNVLRRHLIKPLPWGSRFLAVMDCCHSATLLDLKHHRCNRVSTWPSRGRRLWRRILECVRGPARAGSFDIKICDGFCRRRRQPLQSLAVCVSACKDGQEILEGMALTLTKTVVEQLDANPDLSLRELVYAIIANNECQRREVKQLERQARREGNHAAEAKYRKMLEMRPTPQIASSEPMSMRKARLSVSHRHI